MNNKDIFAKNLKYHMKMQNKTRKQVCEDLGFSYYTFSDWVNGKKYPRMDKVEILANYFNILKSDLIEDKTTSNPPDIELGRQLMSIRQAKNLSIQELASELGITTEDLKAYEQGLKRIPLELMNKLAEYFNVDFSNNINFVYHALPNQSKFQTSLHIIEMTKRWNEEVGEANFTDEEVTELINFAKYLLSKRK